MKSYYGYIRVSTAKQGTHGVSLVEQKSAIERYAERNGLQIGGWFEERETAAKRGRPVFAQMLANLRRASAYGVVMHKIDRSARNLKDWADLGELIDAGVDVHFAADALDLNSRGGRLSADIQAVVAADYIRNLREETKKGFYGRLKQGLYPLGAPIGYLNCGGGKPKIPDPMLAPLIRDAFELYASGRYTLDALRHELKERGLAGRNGKALYISTLSKILHNPFYAGIIRLRGSGETFVGVHEPLTSLETFKAVERILRGKLAPRAAVHDFAFRRLLHCAICSRALVGELQKSRVYYRCHTRRCATTGVREDRVDREVERLLRSLALDERDVEEARGYLKFTQAEQLSHAATKRRGLELVLASATSKLDRLTDALMDGLIDKEMFVPRRAALASEVVDAKQKLSVVDGDFDERVRHAEKVLEFLSALHIGYELAAPADRRTILESTTSNRELRGKYLAITPCVPLDVLSNCVMLSPSDLPRKRTRTWGARKKVLHEFVDRLLVAPNFAASQLCPSSASPQL